MTFAVQQGSYDWIQERVGCATASRFKDVMAKLKNGGPAQARKDYMAEVVCECLTGQPVAKFSNAAMAWGTEMEPEARQAYCIATGNEVDEVSFIRHSSLRCGASPDGIVNLEGCLEIKCPNSMTHMETIIADAVPEQHIPQIQGQLWITGNNWADFVSYDPRMPKGLDLFIRRVYRDEMYITALEHEVRLFLKEVDERVAALLTRAQGGINHE